MWFLGGASIAMRLLLAAGAMETLTKELWGFWGPEGRFWSAPGRATGQTSFSFDVTARNGFFLVASGGEMGMSAKR